jgi:fucose 4-O-acetylase-like acetyltransferase
MPLFMYWSGYLSSSSTRSLIKRFDCLIIPFFAWAVVDYFIRQLYIDVSIISYIKDLILAPDTGLWFLWVLFLCNAGLFFFTLLPRQIKSFAPLLFYLVIIPIHSSHFGLRILQYHYPFFIAGFYSRRYLSDMQINIPRWLSNSALPAMLLLFALCTSIWNRTAIPNLFYSLPLPSVAFNIFKVTTAALGIAIFSLLVIRLSSSGGANVLNLLGRNSLGIYAVQFYFVRENAFYAYILDNQIKILLKTTIALVLSLALIRAMQYSSILKGLFLGGGTLPSSKSWTINGKPESEVSTRA